MSADGHTYVPFAPCVAPRSGKREEWIVTASYAGCFSGPRCGRKSCYIKVGNFVDPVIRCDVMLPNIISTSPGFIECIRVRDKIFASRSHTMQKCYRQRRNAEAKNADAESLLQLYQS